jgi:predicted nucleic acid-binding protein
MINLRKKTRKSQELIASALMSGDGIISSQVMQKFLNVAIKKFLRPLSVEDANIYLSKVLNPLCQVSADFEFYQSALQIIKTYGFSFYDRLILAAAQSARCDILYSEDLQHNQQVGSVKIINPFITS